MFYLTEKDEIKAAIYKLSNHQQLWLDTETADCKTSKRRISLIQVLADNNDKIGDSVYILDVLDKPDIIAEFLDQIIVKPNIEKIFHNASYDLRFLEKITAQNITCTYKIAKAISKDNLKTSNLKLKTLAKELCNFTNINEAESTSNWTKRPLTKQQLDYAKMDVVYLAAVHQYLLNMNSKKHLTVTEVRLAFECPRLFYLNYHFGGKTLFFPPNTIKGVGNIFHQQAADFIMFAKTTPQFKTLFQSIALKSNLETLTSKTQDLFYQLKFFPYLEKITTQQPELAPALYQVWQGLTNLIQQWTKLLINNLPYSNIEQVINNTFIGEEINFEHDFTLPDGSPQKLTGKLDSLVYDLAKDRPCVIEYKTYQPVDPSAQLAQVALYSYIFWHKKQKINDSAVYCVLPEFKTYYYTWEELETTVHQLIPYKLQQMKTWINWEQEKSDIPPATTSPHLCDICPQKEQCQNIFIEDNSSSDQNIKLLITKEKTTLPKPDNIEIEKIAQQLVDILKSFKIKVTYHSAIIGSTFIRFKLKLDFGVKFVSIVNRAEDLKIHLGIDTSPLITSQPGYVSVDLPRKDRQFPDFYNYIKQKESENTPQIALGIDLEGNLIEADLSDSSTCHFLVGGTTGSGKSEFLRSLLLSLIYHHSPENLKIALVDPKRVTFPEFESMPWLYSPIVKDSLATIDLMEQLVIEMERRYKLFELSKSPHLEAYNQQKPPEPRIVCIFDEYADLMIEKETRTVLEESIKRLGAMARAAGIHLIIATQRPEAKIVTPIIRSNLPGRIALRTASEADSSIIFGGKQPEAAYLLGKGDLLFQTGSQFQRLQSLFIKSVKL